MKWCKGIISLFLCLVFISGCAHPLTMENLGMYKPGFINSEYTNYAIGITAATNSPEEERMVMAIANNLKKDGFRVFYPYYPNSSNKQSVDFIARITTSSQYKGSGINFWVNWPGFIIFAPALFGYSYTVKLDFDIDITDTRTGSPLPRISLPIELRIKHADINRTWTEVSWLEFSVIAFIGGLCFMSYDNSVTPLMMDASENKLSDYIGSKIAGTVIADVSTKGAVPSVGVPPSAPQTVPAPAPVMPFQPVKEERK
ncbi:MAG: hypothetical protein ACM3OC_08415 [Deltaproteobacteria bacterium]